MNRMKFIGVVGFLLMLIPSVFALGQVAGKLVIIVPVGASNSTRYGLVNNGNETITAILRAEGDVAEFLSFQENIILPPKKVTFVTITANIPEDYDSSRGGNITGYLYALQEGESGQVTINVQAKKSVYILIPGLVDIPNTETLAKTEISPITGFVSAATSYWSVAVIGVLAIGVIMFLRNYSIAFIKK